LDILPDDLLPFYECFKATAEAIDSAFGFVLDPYYEEKFTKFTEKYLKLVNDFKISVTNKVHIMIKHVPQFIELKGISLGGYSEEAVESAHHSFDLHYNRYRIKDINHFNYGKKMLAAVLSYNAMHL